MVAKHATLEEERQVTATAEAQQKHRDEITQHQNTLRRSQEEALSGFHLNNARARAERQGNRSCVDLQSGYSLAEILNVDLDKTFYGITSCNTSTSTLLLVRFKDHLLIR